ncbi:M48 family metalloprotease [Micromonospora sp. NPDC126480]|uniref:M48 family metalloprotease n=1 Tax=Micromonospora sp. NPDC126480 TaxID=3155312 RepID=UPI003322E49D
MSGAGDRVAATAPPGRVTRDGRPADTGFLLLPLAALVFSTVVLLATLFTATLIVPPGCDLGDVFVHPCTTMVNTFQLTFNAMLIPGAVMFLWLSRWHRRRTRPLDESVFPAAADVIGAVLASVRLPRPVEVVVGPRLGRRAFTGGTGAKPYVALGPELLTLPAKGPAEREIFAAVLRHELAHVQNLDLLRLQFATSLRISTRATALATALLLAAQQVWAAAPLPAGTAAGVFVRTLLLAAAAELVVRAFFRAREHEADLRAAAGAPDGMRAALSAGPERPRGLRERLLARHPAGPARLAGLDDDRGVLALPPGQVLGAGLFTAVALANLQTLVDVLIQVGLIDRPRAGDVPWTPLLIVALAAVPAAVFLPLGVWRDARARRLGGRPDRSALLGAVFGGGLLAGIFLAPYGAFFYDVAPSGPPPATGLIVCVAGAVALCWWLGALVDRAVPTGRARAALLPAAVTVGVALLVLIWESTGWLAAQGSGCAYSPVGCGWPAAPRIVLVLLGEPWATVPLALGTATLLAVALHRNGAGAVTRWWLAGVVTAGAGLVVVLPRLAPADALGLGVWDWLFRPPPVAGFAVSLQVALLVAVTVAVLLPRPVAGPAAGASALLILAVGLGCWLLERTGAAPALRPEEYRPVIGQYLGAGYALVLVAVIGVLGARSGLGRPHRRSAGGTATPPRAEPRAGVSGAGQPADGSSVG